MEKNGGGEMSSVLFCSVLESDKNLTSYSKKTSFWPFSLTRNFFFSFFCLITVERKTKQGCVY